MTKTTKMGIEEAYDKALGSGDNAHLDEVVDRILPVLALTEGLKSVWTRETIKRELIGLITTIREVRKDPVKYGKLGTNQIARFGPLAVQVSIRNDAENFEVFVSVAEVYGMQVLGEEWRKEK
jgi:hypothetical protein